MTLGLLRSDADADEQEDRLLPSPTIEHLDGLLRTYVEAGMTLSVDVRGSPREVSPAAELALVRIIQEALTNATKHAPGSTVALELDWSTDSVQLSVTNERPTRQGVPDHEGTGHGLIGMRERAAIANGSISAGPTPEGGYRVTAAFPTSNASAKRGRRGTVSEWHAARRTDGTMTIRVLLADDQALLRATFRLLIDSTSDMEVVGEAATGAEAVALCRTERADVILMDIRMPELDGIEATRRITGAAGLAQVKIVILTTFETEDLIVEALRAGASAYLGKDVEPATLLEAIRKIVVGDTLLSPSATRALISRVLTQSGGGTSDIAVLDRLTPREREILTLVALGLSNEQIAQRLYISPTTAKTHVNRTMMKLGARDRAQLVIIAYETGVVRPGT